MNNSFTNNVSLNEVYTDRPKVSVVNNTQKDLIPQLK